MDYQQLADSLKVVAEPNRLKILELLSCGELCACDLLKHFDFTQPTLSHHMKILEKEGLVTVRKQAKWHYYSLNQEKTKELTDGLTQVVSNTKQCICRDPEKKC